ncbi:MAG TPA: glycosyltransferase, partial [Oleiagrimonas sp.]|nr:glycosyltransferase [Oleiagrimonas sp.]
MADAAFGLAVAAALIWWGIVLAPWRPWSTRERLEADPGATADYHDVIVLIPARDEAATLPRTLAALARQGAGLRVVVIDDQSSDATAEVARAAGAE